MRFQLTGERETWKCVATLKGHSDWVHCGVRCTFVMMCLRRRSGALPCFRTGGASCLAMALWEEM